MNLLNNKVLKTIALIISLMLTVSIVSITAFASDDAVNASYYESKSLVRVYADIDTKNANAPATVWIVNNGDLYYAYQTNAQADGSLELIFNLNDDIAYEDFIDTCVLKANINGDTYTLVPALGKDIEITQLDWNVDTKTLVVNGICLLDEEITFTVVNSASEVVSEQATYAEDGKYAFSVSLADQNYGVYTVKVANGDETSYAQSSFIFKSHQNVVDELKEEPTGDNFADVLKNIENLKALGISSWINAEGDGFMDLEDDVYDILAKAAADLTDAASVTDAAQKASLVYALNNASDTAAAETLLFTTYKDIINEDDYILVKAYNDLESDTLRTDALNGVTGKDLDSWDAFEMAFANGTLIPQINEMAISSTLSNFVDIYGDYFDIKDTLTAKEYVTVIGNRPYTDIDAFCDKCNLIISNRRSSSGGSVTGGVGGAGTKPGYSNPVNDGGNKIGNTGISGEIREPEAKPVFDDMEDALWAKEAVEALYKRGIVSGYGDGTFNPNGTVKREEFVKMLVCALGTETNNSDVLFADALSGEWYNEYINAAYTAGITKGKENGAFGIGENVTRQDAAVFCYRSFAELSTIETDPKEAFADENKISAYATEAVTKLHNLGIINGMGENRFMPADNLTRAQAAQMLYTILVYGKGGN